MYTTSLAVNGWPLWNLTFGRSLNVHTAPELLGVQLVASIGWRVRSWLLSRMRKSPVWASMLRPPESEIVSGLIAADGACWAKRKVPPDLGVPVAAVVELAVEELFAPPQADRTAASTELDMPITAPLRTKSRRLIRPPTSSSM